MKEYNITILAIDPGNEYSGFVIIDGRKNVIDKGKLDNKSLMKLIADLFPQPDYLAIEMPASYGMAVGRTVFDTCVWVGMFSMLVGPYKTYKVYRKSVNKLHGIDSVAMHLCRSTRAKDSNIRQALIDMYPPTGGGKTPQIGTKKQPGPLYGFSADMWAALAVAVTFADWLKEIETYGMEVAK